MFITMTEHTLKGSHMYKWSSWRADKAQNKIQLLVWVEIENSIDIRLFFGDDI